MVFAAGAEPDPATARLAGVTLARSSGQPERSAFVVGRERDLVAVLAANGGHRPRTVLERAAEAIAQILSLELRAGVGTPFSGLEGFAASYREARRVQRHASAARPFVFGLGEVSVFDELTLSAREDSRDLIPEPTRRLRADETHRETVEAFFAADLQVSVAARMLALHPNSLRYPLRRIAELTGRDPRRLPDLFELVTAPAC